MTVAVRPPTQSAAAKSSDRATQYARAVVDGQVVVGEKVRRACQRHLDDLAKGPARGLRFDVAEAERSIDFFPAALRHWKGELGGRPVVLESWQAFIVGSAFGWKLASGLRRFRLIYIEVGKKQGKALDLDTPLPTPEGWTTMGAVREGDRLFDEHGRPCSVTFATEVMEDHECYRVEFSDGSAVVADRDHLWQTLTRRGPGSRDKRLTDGQVRTTAEIAATVDGWPGKTRYRNHRIPVAGALDLPTADLPVDPYVLGVWLGDGDSRSAVVTVGATDRELVGHLVAAGVTVAQRPVQPPRAERYTLRDGAGRLGVTLRTLGVLGDKHIPMLYLRASIEQRMALLQGLMDTDGSISTKGQCEFTITRKRLVDGMVELLHSLGFKPSIHEGRAKIAGRDVGPRWRVRFDPLADRPVFRLGRKLSRQRMAATMARRSLVRHITAVVPVASVPVRCIQVDSPSHLFLAGEAMIPTHNTLMAAGFGLRLAFFDGEPGAEVYSVATTRDQAKMVWNDARHAVEKSPALSRRLTTVDSRSNIHDPATGSKFEPLSKDSKKSAQGINPHGGIIDELHVATERETWDNLESAMASRRQPMRVAITTAGVKRQSLWAEVRADVLSIVEGRATDDSVFGYVATLDDGDDPFDEAVWPKSNPNIGVSVSWEFLREKAAIAKRSPGAMGSFMRYHMNVPTQQSNRWFAIDVWDTGARPVEIEAGQACYGGLDLATVRDITALLLVFKADDGTYDLLCRFWCPAEGIEERSRVDNVPYADWVRDGWLIATEGNVTDYDQVFAEAQRLAETYYIGEIGYDRWNATQLVTQLTSEGASMVPVSQTFTGLSAASKELEKAILSGRIRHAGNPVLRWMAGNVELETDANENIRPSKARSSERIDGIVALVMAISRWMANGDPVIWSAA